MSLQISTSGMKTVLGRLKGNLNMLFWLMVFGLFLAEGFMIFRAVRSAMESGKPALEIKPSTVRVNFNGYKAIAERIEQAQGYTPMQGVVRNPFGVKNATQ